MQFMLMLKGDPGNPHDESAPVAAEPNNELVSAMIRYHNELVGAGVLVGAEGLLPSATGKRVAYRRGRRKVIDGPFAEAKELVAGYYVIDVASLDEAVEWAAKCPVEYACEGDMEAIVEVRQIASLDDVEGVSEENRTAEKQLREKLIGS
jgi:hypothetical protein